MPWKSVLDGNFVIICNASRVWRQKWHIIYFILLFAAFYVFYYVQCPIYIRLQKRHMSPKHVANLRSKLQYHRSNCYITEANFTHMTASRVSICHLFRAQICEQTLWQLNKFYVYSTIFSRAIEPPVVSKVSKHIFCAGDCVCICVYGVFTMNVNLRSIRLEFCVVSPRTFCVVFVHSLKNVQNSAVDRCMHCV